jgi:hypothetical protein
MASTLEDLGPSVPERIPRHIMMLIISPYVILALVFALLLWKIDDSKTTVIQKNEQENCEALKRGREDTNDILRDIVNNFPRSQYTQHILDQINNRDPIEC